MIAVLTGLQQERDLFRDVPGLVVLCGAGQRDALARLVPGNCTGIVSAGCAGALQPGLAVGTLVVASSVQLVDSLWVPDAAWSAVVKAKTGALSRAFFSDPRELAGTPAQKAQLRSQLRADVVDEESFMVARVATNRGLPWLVLRAISDTADQTILPGDTKAQRPDGSEDVGAVIGDALRDPAEAFRETAGFLRSIDVLREALGKLPADLGLGLR